MATVLLTKNELKKQRNALKLYSRYLPTLQLKKQQLQTVLKKVSEKLEGKSNHLKNRMNQVTDWVSVVSEQGHNLDNFIKIQKIDISTISIAGVEVPVYNSINYQEVTYDLFTTPLWMDTAVKTAQELKALVIETDILRKQVHLLSEELLITAQRVNLFEKVKIPQAKEIIRRIQVYNADQQTAAVVRGKISKKKLAEHKV
jgi:V/A-type H+-transporting ATPase subunit D